MTATEGEETEARRAWELLASLIAFDPAQRPTAASALLGPYLNSDCGTSEAPRPAAEPWTVEATVEAVVDTVSGGNVRHMLEADECALPLS